MKTLLVLIGLLAGGMLIAIVLLWSHASEQDLACADNLCQIGIALENYHATFHVYPPPNEGQHSWRIRLIPFLFASSMFEEYRFYEPWNSEMNITLDSRPLPNKFDEMEGPHGMPLVYSCGNNSNTQSMTAYLMFVGEHAFGNPGGQRTRDEITDQLECTLVAAETRPTIHWLDPRDFDVDTISYVINDTERVSISSPHWYGPAVLFADGSVFRISPKIDADTLRALITIDGGEDIDRDDLVARGMLREA